MKLNRASFGCKKYRFSIRGGTKERLFVILCIENLIVIARDFRAVIMQRMCLWQYVLLHLRAIVIFFNAAMHISAEIFVQMRKSRYLCSAFQQEGASKHGEESS
jgi:hypothetical protein